MKGKFKLFGHIGLALFLVSVMVLALAPVAQAVTAVTEVWVDFPDADDQNESGGDTDNVYLVHFKPTTALERGVDKVTVNFPDGSATLSGTAGSSYAFSCSSSMGASDVDFSTTYDTSADSSLVVFTDCTSTPVVGTYRVQVLTPIDVAAGQDVWVRFAGDDITSATTAGNNYKVYVSTTKDTTPVLSSAFSLDATVPGAPTTTVSPASAGASAQYKIYFVPDTALTADTHTVSIQFPVGTVLPSSISASDVQFADDADSGYVATGTAPTVDQDRRIVTATTSVDSDGDADVLYVKILATAGITNPTYASTSIYKTMVKTSVDGEWKVGSAHTISAGSIDAIKVCDGYVGLSNTRYSDDATMINMYSSALYITLVDTYGNAKAPASNVTVTPSSSSGSGSFYINASQGGGGAMSTATTITVSTADPATAAQEVYYKDSAAGTHTLTFTASGYTTATHTFTVCPAVSLYDSSNNLVRTFGPTTTVDAAETATSSATDASHFGSDFVNDAITAAIAGDTVKLGDGIYEVDDYINLNKKITLTSVNGAAYTTLRPVSEPLSTPWASASDVAVVIGVTGTAANPVVVDGLTFTRLRAASEFDQAVYNNGYNYVTVQNCVFDYIVPAQVSDHEYGAVVQFLSYDAEAGGGDAAITSGTISNNTFTNCCTFGFTTWGEQGANISAMAKTGGTAHTMTGITISNNTLTDCNGIGIWLKGYTASTETVKALVTDNTLTNVVYPISIGGYTDTCSILRNTITGGYQCGLWVEFDNHDSLTIKNNTFTDCAGTGAPSMDYSCVVLLYDDGGAGDEVTLQYNDFSDNDATYSIYVKSDIAGGAQHCQYNYYDDASGPYYSAVTGATITKSNPNGTGDQITDLVTYYPWLHKPLADVVADNASYQSSNMKLLAGWNTVSTPVKLISTADSIDELIPSGMTIGYYYDNGWQQITTGYVLSPCDAVYVKMSAITYVQLKFDASAFTTPSKDLDAGWNLISMAALDSDGKKDKQVVASVYRTADNLPGYSLVVSPSVNAAQTDMYGNTGTSWTYSVDETTGDGTNTVYAGLGYWCYMSNAATLAGFEITPIVPDLD